MRTVKLTLFLTAALFSGCAALEPHSKNAPTLYRHEVNKKNPGGKDFVMTLEELRRDERTSTIKITFQSGAALPSVMFVVRGFYDIARARDASFFIQLKEWEEPNGDWMYLVGFSRSRNVDPQKYFGLSQPLPKDDEHDFVAVEKFDVFFRKYDP